MEKPTITYAKFKEVIDSYIQNEKNKDKIVMFSGCLERGMVKRTSMDLNLCSNPECKNCTDLQKQMELSLKQY